MTEAEFRRRIVERFASLSPRQQAVADFVLDHLFEIPFLPVPQLARRIGSSEATIVRFAQSIGYRGLAELKTDLADALRRQMSGGESRDTLPEALAETSHDDMLATVARQEITNIEKTVGGTDRAAFGAAAVALLRADHVYTFGLGISQHVSATLCYLLTQIGLRSTALSTGFSSPLEQLTVLRPTDLLVAFSFPPYSRQTIELVQRAADQGVPSLAVCDRPTAPAAAVAKIALSVRSDNMMFTNSFAAISVLLNALVTETALRNRPQSAEAVTRISEVLDQDPGVLEE